MSRCAAVAFAVVLAGCTSTWQTECEVRPVSYAALADEVPRYAGKLRRLLALAPVVESVEAKCAERIPGDAALWVEREVRSYLVDWKGYELQHAAAPELARALGAWQARTPEQGTPPETVAAKLRALAAEAGVDGVLVMHAAMECIDVGDITMMLLVVGMPSFYGKLFGRDFSAGIYDASGTLVWQGYTGLGPLELDVVFTRNRVVAAVEALFGPLENAIPEVLLRER